MEGREALARSVEAVAAGAAGKLRELADSGRLAEDTRTARELCAVLRDALAVERELRAEENSAAVVVRFEGAAEDASV